MGTRSTGNTPYRLAASPIRRERDKVMNAIQELQRLLRDEGTFVTDTQAESIARRVSSSVEAYLAHRRQPRPTSRPLIHKTLRAVA